MNLKDYLILIPARKNSKRIVGKNLRELNGKPLISYSIEYALKCGIISKNIWINTDDNKIIDLAKSYNVSIYKRPNHLALDKTLYDEVMIDFIDFLKKENLNFSNIVTLQPTNPIRSKDLLLKSISKFDEAGLSSLMSVSLLNKKFGKIINGKYSPVNYNFGDRHQDIEDLYFENGLIYISKIDMFLDKKKYLKTDIYPYITDEIGSHIDIDYESDLALAELILKNES